MGNGVSTSICKAAVDCCQGPAFVTALSAEWVILLEDGK